MDGYDITFYAIFILTDWYLPTILIKKFASFYRALVSFDRIVQPDAQKSNVNFRLINEQRLNHCASRWRHCRSTKLLTHRIRSIVSIVLFANIALRNRLRVNP